MHGMKLRHWIGVVLLVLSLLLLLWGLWPVDLSIRTVPISPTEMQLPMYGSLMEVLSFRL